MKSISNQSSCSYSSYNTHLKHVLNSTSNPKVLYMVLFRGLTIFLCYEYVDYLVSIYNLFRVLHQKPLAGEAIAL